MIEVIEIVNRCDQEQGILRPFICECEDGEQYFLKGSNSTAQGLIREWIAANLASEFGLPTPTVEIGYIDMGLRQVVTPEWQGDLQFEHGFMSHSVAPCETVLFSDLSRIPLQLKRDILMFDYWIQNSDRHLTEMGGNINLLMTPVTKSLMVIDFNLSFEEPFSAQDMDGHVFRGTLHEQPLDLASRAEYGLRFDKAKERLAEFIREIPQEWVDSSASSKTILKHIEETLARHTQDEFWGALT
ncbi:HipA family kinase [Marinobacterium arenosum]|uniref:HipA family kinase n=1 Tax=Marinobacterium arenosum TaxID=2862496 RepID=UPI001C987745|nr:HipA family kinase [Marinobacterium arenosum]MBY4676813.1 hypothetical protein [Marinobacterium arenosum]